MCTNESVQDQLYAELLENVGVAADEIDTRHPADLTVAEIARQMAGYYAAQRRYAASIARDMAAVAEGAQTAHALTASSDLMNYDATIASIDALRQPLAVAIHAMRKAHTADTAAPARP